MPLKIISVENAKLLIKTSSPKRLALLQQLHTMGKTTIRALAKQLTRDYSNVHGDIKTLHKAGLILQEAQTVTIYHGIKLLLKFF